MDKSQQVFEALKFFGAASPDAWQAISENIGVMYRKSTTIESNFGAVTAWLRQGELEAQAVECAPYNAETFRNTLTHIRALTMEPVSLFQKKW